MPLGTAQGDEAGNAEGLCTTVDKIFGNETILGQVCKGSREIEKKLMYLYRRGEYGGGKKSES